MTKKDVKFIVGLCVISIIVVFGYFLYSLHNYQNHTNVNVYYHNELIEHFDLSKDATYKVEGDVGNMTIEVKDNAYRVINVDCPNHQCEQVGWVKKGSLNTILCVPNDIYIIQE